MSKKKKNLKRLDNKLSFNFKLKQVTVNLQRLHKDVIKTSSNYKELVENNHTNTSLHVDNNKKITTFKLPKIPKKVVSNNIHIDTNVQSLVDNNQIKKNIITNPQANKTTSISDTFKEAGWGSTKTIDLATAKIKQQISDTVFKMALKSMSSIKGITTEVATDYINLFVKPVPMNLDPVQSGANNQMFMMAFVRCIEHVAQDVCTSATLTDGYLLIANNSIDNTYQNKFLSTLKHYLINPFDGYQYLFDLAVEHVKSEYSFNYNALVSSFAIGIPKGVNIRIPNQGEDVTSEHVIEWWQCFANKEIFNKLNHNQKTTLISILEPMIDYLFVAHSIDSGKVDQRIIQAIENFDQMSSNEAQNNINNHGCVVKFVKGNPGEHAEMQIIQELHDHLNDQKYLDQGQNVAYNISTSKLACGLCYTATNFIQNNLNINYDIGGTHGKVFTWKAPEFLSTNVDFRQKLEDIEKDGQQYKIVSTDKLTRQQIFNPKDVLNNLEYYRAIPIGAYFANEEDAREFVVTHKEKLNNLLNDLYAINKNVEKLANYSSANELSELEVLQKKLVNEFNTKKIEAEKYYKLIETVTSYFKYIDGEYTYIQPITKFEDKLPILLQTIDDSYHQQPPQQEKILPSKVLSIYHPVCEEISDDDMVADKNDEISTHKGSHQQQPLAEVLHLNKTTITEKPITYSVYEDIGNLDNNDKEDDYISIYAPSDDDLNTDDVSIVENTLDTKITDYIDFDPNEANDLREEYTMYIVGDVLNNIVDDIVYFGA